MPIALAHDQLAAKGTVGEVELGGDLRSLSASVGPSFVRRRCSGTMSGTDRAITGPFVMAGTDRATTTGRQASVSTDLGRFTPTVAGDGSRRWAPAVHRRATSRIVVRSGSEHSLGPTGERPCPAFFIHIRDGAGLAKDPEGIDAPDLEAARREALTAAKQALADHLIGGGRLSEVMARSLEIADEAGRTVSVVTYAEASETPGVRPAGR